MKKGMTTLCLAAFIALSLAACGNNKTSETEVNKETPVTETIVVTESKESETKESETKSTQSTEAVKETETQTDSETETEESADGTQATPTATSKSNEEIAREVLNGAWGSGDSRRNQLQQAGYNPDEIQTAVNRLTDKENADSDNQSVSNAKTNKKDNDEIAQEVANGNWGSSEERRQRLQEAGYDPDEIQALVNKIFSGESKSNTKASADDSDDEYSRALDRVNYYNDFWSTQSKTWTYNKLIDEGFSEEAAEYAVNQIPTSEWNARAVTVALGSLVEGGSKASTYAALYDLYGYNHFTEAEANYAIDYLENVEGIDWNEEALKCAQEIERDFTEDGVEYSDRDMWDKLNNIGFKPNEIQYAIDHLDD